MYKNHLITYLIFLIPLIGFAQETDTIWSTKISDMYDAKITPDNSRIIVANEESIIVLDAVSGENIIELETESKHPYTIEISSDSKFL